MCRIGLTNRNVVEAEQYRYKCRQEANATRRAASEEFKGHSGFSQLAFDLVLFVICFFEDSSIRDALDAWFYICNIDEIEEKFSLLN